MIPDKVECKEVIVSTLLRRGLGETYDPVRIVTQVFEKDGTFIAEHDPKPFVFTIMDLVNFHNWCIKQGDTNPSGIGKGTAIKWLDSLNNKL